MHIKRELHATYKHFQNIFDKKFRYFKRKASKKEFIDIENECKDNPTAVWERIRKSGDPFSSRTALEIVREDGSISNDVQEVLERWHEDISALYSGLRENPEFAFNDKFLRNIIEKKNELEQLEISGEDSMGFIAEQLNDVITYEEVSSAIDRSKNNKS